MIMNCLAGTPGQDESEDVDSDSDSDVHSDSDSEDVIFDTTIYSQSE